MYGEVQEQYDSLFINVSWGMFLEIIFVVSSPLEDLEECLGTSLGNRVAVPEESCWCPGKAEVPVEE